MGPLQGVRILDLTQMLAGPYGSMILGDLGAEVIKIEPPRGDETRLAPIQIGGESAYFMSINRNKKSISINLKSDEGLELFYELVKVSDVVFDNFRPEVVKRLKIDFDTLKEIKPKIICASISSFGTEGPYSHRPGYDLIVQAMGGGMSITGEPGGKPVRSGIPIGDLAGGTYAAMGILAALFEVEKTGQGRKIEVSLLDGQIGMLTYQAMYYFANGEVPQPVGSGHPILVVYEVFKTKDIYIAVVAHRGEFWEGFCRAIEKPELADDPKFGDMFSRFQNKVELYALIEKQLQTRPGEYWLERLLAEEVPAGPVNAIDKALSNEQVIRRNMIIDVDDPKRGKYKMTGNPIKISGYPNDRIIPPPLFAEHTEEVLADLLGCLPERIAELKLKQVII